jgi:hypothetical protein
MEAISRTAILQKTHQGIKVYAHVLRKYYPGQTVLSLSGKDCAPARNPFNSGKPTLMISLRGNGAEHYDTEKAIPAGDAIDFAGIHYNKTGDELLNCLNEDMFLRIGLNFYDSRSTVYDVFTDALNEQSKKSLPVFSYYRAPITNTIPERDIDVREVYRLIKGKDFIDETSALRSIQEARQARKYKARSFDYVTFSGTFPKRHDKQLLSHSGLLTIDFDHVRDMPKLKQALLHDPYFETTLLFTSPSGDGLKWIIPIDLNLANHQDYFLAVSNYIQHTYRLTIDQSGKDVSRACFLPHDPDVFINSKYL